MTIGFRQQFADHQHLPGLPGLTEQIGEVRHMCPVPDCVKPVGGAQISNPFCPVCLGAGSITSERLDRWQWEQNTKRARGES